MSQRRALIAFIVAMIVALTTAISAYAHAIIVRTDPADGAELADAPRQVRLWFSEGVLLDFTRAELIANDGHSMSIGRIQPDATDSRALVIDLPHLSPGVYRLTWRTLSDDDLHSSTGAIVFGVQTAPALAPPATPALAPPPLEVLLRWLNFITLAGVIGLLAVALLILPESTAGFNLPLPTRAASEMRVVHPELPNMFSEVKMGTRPHLHASSPSTSPEYLRRIRSRCLKGAACLACAAGLVGVGLLVVQAGGESTNTDLGRTLWPILTQTGYGAQWLMRQGWLAALVLIIYLHLRGRLLSDQPRGLLAVLMPLLVVLVISHVLTSHAAATRDTSILPVAVEALHLLAACLWVGGLLALAITVVPLLRRGPVEKKLARLILRRFSILAAASVAALAVTGLYSSGQQVATLDALVLAPYGQSLMLKIGLAAGVAIIGLINASLLHPHVAELIRRVLRRPTGWTPLPARHLWLTIMLESIGATIVLLFAALLTASSPARGPEFDPPAETLAPSSISANADDLFINLSVKPNRPGPNFITLGVFDTRRPVLAPIERVAMRLQAPAQTDAETTLVATATDKNHYQITGNAIDTPGTWNLTIVVIRSGVPDTTLNVPWIVLPVSRASNSRPVLISNEPLAPLTTVLAMALTAGLGAVVAGWGLKHFGQALALPLNHRRHLIRKE